MTLPTVESRYVLPNTEEKTPYGYRTLDPYTKLFRDRILFLTAPVDATSAGDLVVQLLALDAEDKDADITLYINSPGGSITDMAMVIDTINLIQADVSTVALGLAASAAAVLLAAGTPGKRYALPNARIMVHQPRTGESTRGQASDIAIQAKEILRTREWMEEFLASRTGKPVEEIHKDLERDKFLTSADAVEYGIIDKVL